MGACGQTRGFAGKQADSNGTTCYRNRDTGIAKGAGNIKRQKFDAGTADGGGKGGCARQGTRPTSAAPPLLMTVRRGINRPRALLCRVQCWRCGAGGLGLAAAAPLCLFLSTLAGTAAAGWRNPASKHRSQWW